MASLYDARRAEITRQINAQKNIYKFRNFLYSINKDIRNHCFNITRDFLENEQQNNETLSLSEKERLLNILNHWEWNIFENASTNWWSTLSYNHSKSLSLITAIHLWIDDINVFDPDAFETSTLGIR